MHCLVSKLGLFNTSLILRQNSSSVCPNVSSCACARAVDTAGRPMRPDTALWRLPPHGLGCLSGSAAVWKLTQRIYVGCNGSAAADLPKSDACTSTPKQERRMKPRCVVNPLCPCLPKANNDHRWRHDASFYNIIGNGVVNIVDLKLCFATVAGLDTNRPDCELVVVLIVEVNRLDYPVISALPSLPHRRRVKRITDSQNGLAKR